MEKTELWVKITPKGEYWLSVGLGYGSGFTSKELLELLIDHKELKVSELISHGIYYGEKEMDLNSFLKELDGRGVIELYEKEAE